jgi:hypothetical protein
VSSGRRTPPSRISATLSSSAWLPLCIIRTSRKSRSTSIVLGCCMSLEIPHLHSLRICWTASLRSRSVGHTLILSSALCFRLRMARRRRNISRGRGCIILFRTLGRTFHSRIRRLLLMLLSRWRDFERNIQAAARCALRLGTSLGFQDLKAGSGKQREDAREKHHGC